MVHKKIKRKNRKNKFWIQRAVKRPGRIKRYIKRKYGKKAFTKTGKIKINYLHKAIKETKNCNLKNALLLAIRLKQIKR
jgi:hypothetical protein